MVWWRGSDDIKQRKKIDVWNIQFSLDKNSNSSSNSNLSPKSLTISSKSRWKQFKKSNSH